MDASRPASSTSYRSLLFLSPMTTAHDHSPTRPCVALSRAARSHRWLWTAGIRTAWSATTQKAPRPPDARREAELKVCSSAWAFSASTARLRGTRGTRGGPGRRPPSRGEEDGEEESSLE